MKTFSAASETVRTKVEKTGAGCKASGDHTSKEAPIGKQNIGTDDGSPQLGLSLIGYLDNIP